MKQWKKVLFKDFWRSSQQRVCLGFAPDSLFSAFSEVEKTPPKIQGQR